MRPIIQVRGLSKRYRIGAQRARYGSLRESLTSWARRPFEALKKKGRLHHPTIWALKDVTFDVMPGEVLGVIGRNGAGKSTLLKVLSRITEPTEGEVDLFGRVGSLLEVGTGFHPELTGRENIFLNGAVLGMTRAEIDRKFDEIVAFAEVESFLDTPVKHYSSGTSMRLAFAVAAHLEPEILLVDEVLAVGDIHFQKKCLGKMGEVARQGRTVLFVSHNLNAVEELCSAVILLERGEIRNSGRGVRDILNEYSAGLHSGTLASEWLNPGRDLANPWLQPVRFALTDETGRVLRMPVRNDSQIWVHLDGFVQQSDPALNLGYALFSDDGRLLYWSVSTDGPESQWPKLRPGPCSLRSRIPSRLLNEGDYHLELIVSLYYRQWISQPGVNAPAIVLSIRGGLSDSPYWVERRPGLLGPELRWVAGSEPDPQ